MLTTSYSINFPFTITPVCVAYSVRVHINSIPTMPGLLHPYLKNQAVLDCPSFIGSQLDARFRSYAICRQYLYYPDYPQTGWENNYRPASLATIQNPAETLIMADSAQAANNQLFREVFLTPPSQSIPSGRPLVHGRHTGRADVLWYDGHVKSMKPIIPTKDTPSGTATFFRDNSLGDLLRQPYTGDPVQDDYYFELVKPQ